MWRSWLCARRSCLKLLNTSDLPRGKPPTCDGWFFPPASLSARVISLDSSVFETVNPQQSLKMDVACQSGLPTPFVACCTSKLIESVRVIARVASLSLLGAIQRTAYMSDWLPFPFLFREFRAMGSCYCHQNDTTNESFVTPVPMHTGWCLAWLFCERSFQHCIDVILWETWDAIWKQHSEQTF